MSAPELKESNTGFATAVKYLPFEQWESKGVPWAISIDIENEPTICIVRNTNEIVNKITMNRLMEFWTL